MATIGCQERRIIAVAVECDTVHHIVSVWIAHSWYGIGNSLAPQRNTRRGNHSIDAGDSFSRARTRLASGVAVDRTTGHRWSFASRTPKIHCSMWSNRVSQRDHRGHGCQKACSTFRKAFQQFRGGREGFIDPLLFLAFASFLRRFLRCCVLLLCGFLVCSFGHCALERFGILHLTFLVGRIAHCDCLLSRRG